VHSIISQDIVATRSEFDVQYNNCFVVYLILNSMLKKILKSVNIWLSYGQKYRGPFFDSQCIYTVLGSSVSVDVLDIALDLNLDEEVV
jgi:hypothetical protein